MARTGFQESAKKTVGEESLKYISKVFNKLEELIGFSVRVGDKKKYGWDKRKYFYFKGKTKWLPKDSSFYSSEVDALEAAKRHRDNRIKFFGTKGQDWSLKGIQEKEGRQEYDRLRRIRDKGDPIKILRKKEIRAAPEFKEKRKQERIRKIAEDPKAWNKKEAERNRVYRQKVQPNLSIHDQNFLDRTRLAIIYQKLKNDLIKDHRGLTMAANEYGPRIIERLKQHPVFSQLWNKLFPNIDLTMRNLSIKNVTSASRVYADLIRSLETKATGARARLPLHQTLFENAVK